MPNSIFARARILLPGAHVDMEKWAVIACDQHTADRDYWENVDAFVGDAPSTLRLIVPEVYLEDANSAQRLREAALAMENYAESALQSLDEGMIFLRREGRKGLLLALDLEKYDYRPESGAPVRATEKTIEERLPARRALREQALLELPHILLLMDDREENILGEMDGQNARKVYDFPLMMEGGRIEGFALSDAQAQEMLDKLHALARNRAPGCAFAVGDGNHSLAAAKTYWESIKADVPQDHPARYGLLELVSLHDSALHVLPIHRFVFGANMDLLKDIPRGNGPKIRVYCGKEEAEIGLPEGRLAVETLQSYLDAQSGLEMDFIHEERYVRQLAGEGRGLGIVLPDLNRSLIFSTVQEKGVLPRKSFSLGESREKRYYLECRRIRD